MSDAPTDIVRYALPGDEQARVGLRGPDGITPLPGVGGVAGLLRLRAAELRELVEAAPGPATVDPAAVATLPPVDGRTELWAAGVTYERSRGARVEESSESSVYEKVYDAPRPELFLKSVAWRLVTEGEPVAVRADSTIDVPEPELAVVANRYGEIVGYTVCNDMSSRSIEGENPLYIPQAKIFNGCCSVAAGIRPAWQVADPYDLDIELSIVRGGAVAWRGGTSTARLHRRLDDLVAALFAPTDFPDGAVLATGTGVVPELSFSLEAGDRVDIAIAGVGTLSNPVVRGREALSWLVDAADRPFARGGAR
ncbi:fumarylacetoacetate hydrolase family protein [Allonocardiopsis opalescens]|uniref:2-dehydro-3-deoxy-D-arabinonate dehydratase n=1 Tax=Allonocardiopsis opalescens TaxID=1144618 RepID=A0A2T0QE91_9ACTN|nr:fumarylacetoacetate hydrolase family protein [Allonocardiopsis opalescens]PRY02225.1 2-dehydro-3-deoxy-D-arabinonate dehydratase [Allonocardiopsis opalescens]